MLEYIPLIGIILPKVQKALNKSFGSVGYKIFSLSFSKKEIRVGISYFLAFAIALITVIIQQPPTFQEFFTNLGVYLAEAFALSQAAYYLYFRKPEENLEDQGKVIED
jgi:hypothetical protein